MRDCGHDAFLLENESPVYGGLTGSFLHNLSLELRSGATADDEGATEKIGSQKTPPKERVDYDSILSLIPPKTRILDLGCGKGDLLLRIDHIDYKKANDGQSARKVGYEGERRKSPNCGDIIDPYETVCEACGFEIRGRKTTSVVHELSLKLEKTDDARKKDELIRNFIFLIQKWTSTNSSSWRSLTSKLVV